MCLGTQTCKTVQVTVLKHLMIIKIAFQISFLMHTKEFIW